MDRHLKEESDAQTCHRTENRLNDLPKLKEEVTALLADNS